MTKYIGALLLAWIVGITAGCGIGKFKRTANATIHTQNSTSLEQKGGAEVPATVKSQKSAVVFTIPKDSIFWFDPELKKLVLQFSKDVPAVATNTNDTITGPKTYAPPTATDEAKGSFTVKAYYFALGLLLLGGLMIYIGHIKAGIISICGAVVTCGFAWFVGNSTAQWVAAIFLALSGGVWIAWYFVKNKLDAKTILSEARDKIAHI